MTRNAIKDALAAYADVIALVIGVALTVGSLVYTWALAGRWLPK